MHTTRTLGNPEPVTKSAFGPFLSFPSFFLSPILYAYIYSTCPLASHQGDSRGEPEQEVKSYSNFPAPPTSHLISDTLPRLSTIIQTLERKPKDLLYVWPPISIEGDNIEIHFITSVSTYFQLGGLWNSRSVMRTSCNFLHSALQCQHDIVGCPLLC